MTNTHGPTSTPSIGFVTVTRDSDQTLYGGFLVLSAVGRPLEFHCTAPVRATRAQQILYGPVLEPYLYGERIAQTLITAARKPPTIVLTDRKAAMAARPLVRCPLVLLDEKPAEATASNTTVSSGAERFHRLDGPHRAPATHAVRLERFQVEQYSLAVCAEHAVDRQGLVQAWPTFADQLDLHEPFQRIREAIEEARNGA